MPRVCVSFFPLFPYNQGVLETILDEVEKKTHKKSQGYNKRLCFMVRLGDVFLSGSHIMT